MIQQSRDKLWISDPGRPDTLWKWRRIPPLPATRGNDNARGPLLPADWQGSLPVIAQASINIAVNARRGFLSGRFCGHAKCRHRAQRQFANIHIDETCLKTLFGKVCGKSDPGIPTDISRSWLKR